MNEIDELKKSAYRKVIYICGPYRSQSGEWFVNNNVRKAERLAELVWKARGVALCPHKNTQGFGGLIKDDHFIKGDLEILKRCDALLTVSGWEHSEGSHIEVEFAIAHNIPVFHQSGAAYGLPVELEMFLGNLDERETLYKKYVVTKADGSSVDPNAQYFVLRIDTDLCARKALVKYAEQVGATNKRFAQELLSWLNSVPLNVGDKE